MNSNRIKTTATMSATATAINSNFKKVFQEEFELTMVQTAQSMFDKYYTEAYTIYQVHLIDDMILSVLPYSMSSVSNKRKDLRMKCWKKSSWMSQMKVITRDVVNKVSKRKCNDCKKMWCDCRNTCIKPKTNPRPIELPQDVFNVIKDYLGVYDIPEPVTELMDMMKLKNLITADKDMPDHWCISLNIKKRKDLSVDERVRLYNAYVIRSTKKLWNNGSAILDIANKYPQLRFGKELTDNNKIFLLRLLFNDYYNGVWGDGGYDVYSLFDILCGDIGISGSKIIHKKPKPYVMYLENDKNKKWWVCSNHYLNHVGFGCGDIRRSDVLALRSYVYY